MSNCLFCKIIAGDIPSTKVYEDELVYAFRDIVPQAPTHVLVVPKAHIESCNGITAENSAVVAHIFEVIPAIAKAEGLEGGYRVVSNCETMPARRSIISTSTSWAARSWLWKWRNGIDNCRGGSLTLPDFWSRSMAKTTNAANPKMPCKDVLFRLSL